MLKINLKIVHQGIPFIFSAEIEQGKPHTFEIGEEQLADKLFFLLSGLKPLPPQQSLLQTMRYQHPDIVVPKGIDEISDSLDIVNFSRSSLNNVLAIGDPTMFLSKGTSVYKNVYTVLRARDTKVDAKQKTDEVIKHYQLDPKSKLKNLSDNQLLALSLARSHFRVPKFIIVNKLYFLKNLEINFDKWKDSYVVVII
ncbi:MAG: hypothetical protein FWE01_01305 [Firmicutes bacterium]|nr:hypothetical protein [Bacillota bacterium]